MVLVDQASPIPCIFVPDGKIFLKYCLKMEAQGLMWSEEIIFLMADSFFKNRQVWGIANQELGFLKESAGDEGCGLPRLLLLFSYFHNRELAKKRRYKTKHQWSKKKPDQDKCKGGEKRSFRNFVKVTQFFYLYWNRNRDSTSCRTITFSQFFILINPNIPYDEFSSMKGYVCKGGCLQYSDWASIEKWKHFIP